MPDATDQKLLKVGIAVDDWKFPIFERLLKQHGYAFKNAGELSPNVLLLSVSTTNASALLEVVKTAQAEAALTGAPQ